MQTLYSVNYSYNLLGQLTNTTDSAGVSVTNWFNNQGFLYAVSHAFGQPRLLTFDDEFRVTNTRHPNRSFPTFAAALS